MKVKAIKTKTLTLTQSINNLRINLDNFDITIKLGNKPKIKYSANENDVPIIQTNDDQLMVKSPKHHFSLFNFVKINRIWRNNKLLLVLPKTTHLTDAKLNLDTGNLSVNHSNIQKDIKK
ncbi:DUF4097 family beta strand repeat-containing protein [Acetilactobacillus jinshanensis]|uniref:DUF4097 domain-containing protein n=1 Tax=Acetilactobacillus jinshanensis TaxID=1720083 RepID=A0A4P6ZKF4_9LACO|nr:DUF4097 family beta strand repeat-containing protein [Acetilactobacillus jinshanensis]QBP17997.1 hypothetical protein ELX58_02275 [Acetilactobacillus jinshanensis]URL60859.1 DUF4097 domain-containing protein [uncultured bacterium]